MTESRIRLFSQFGKTALDLAIQQQSHECIALLKQVIVWVKRRTVRTISMHAHARIHSYTDANTGMPYIHWQQEQMKFMRVLFAAGTANANDSSGSNSSGNISSGGNHLAFQTVRYHLNHDLQ